MPRWSRPGTGILMDTFASESGSSNTHARSAATCALARHLRNSDRLALADGIALRFGVAGWPNDWTALAPRCSRRRRPPVP